MITETNQKEEFISLTDFSIINYNLAKEREKITLLFPKSLSTFKQIHIKMASPPAFSMGKANRGKWILLKC